MESLRLENRERNGEYETEQGSSTNSATMLSGFYIFEILNGEKTDEVSQFFGLLNFEVSDEVNFGAGFIGAELEDLGELLIRKFLFFFLSIPICFLCMVMR